MTATKTAKQDRGAGLSQSQQPNTPQGYVHWKIEGYDVIAGSSFEGSHTSRWTDIELNGEVVKQVRTLSEARGWIRTQAGK